MSFYTAINCMDGRTQLPVINYLKDTFGAEYIDTITEPGPVRLLAEKQDSVNTESILHRVGISVNHHKSKRIAIIAHYDCAGNPEDEQKQKGQLQRAVDFIKGKFPSVAVTGLWVGSDWTVMQVC